MVLEIGAIVGSVLVLFLFSWLFYGRNVLFDIAESCLIGTAAGYMLIIGIKTVWTNAFVPLFAGKILQLIPVVLGLVLYLQLNRKTIHFARIPTAIIVGTGIGLSIRKMLLAGITANISAFAIDWSRLTGIELLNAIIVLIGFVTALSYFVMTKEHKGTYGSFVKVGRIFLMLTFGALFGASITGGLNLIAGRIREILLAFGLI